MPVISDPCNLTNILDETVGYGEFMYEDILKFMFRVHHRAGLTSSLDIYIKRGNTNIDTQTLVLMRLNMLKRELNTKLEQEKKEGKELSQEDKDMIHILENILPDLVINFCRRQRNTKSMKNLVSKGGYRRKTKKNRNKKSRKNRK